jgi:uncharacterized protein YaaN involved in tellurite resistance
MTVITEDTPEAGPEDLQWQIDRLVEQVERDKAELERERHMRKKVDESYFKLRDTYETLISRLTVGVLRKAGFTVEIELAEFCEACGEEF